MHPTLMILYIFYVQIKSTDVIVYIVTIWGCFHPFLEEFGGEELT